MPVSATHAPVLRRHREAAMAALLPNTKPTSAVWVAFVERGDTTDRRLRDIVAAAQLAADAEAGLLLPEGERPKPAPLERVPVQPSSGVVMSPRYENPQPKREPPDE